MNKKLSLDIADSSVVEYESDGKINAYTLDLSDGMPDKIVAHSVSASRPATWLDVLPTDSVPSPWNPPALSQLLRKVLGKLGEETNELATVLFRIHIQGLDALVPGTTKTNRQWLEEEIADVLATSAQTVKHLALDLEFIDTRASKKTTYLEKWYLMPDVQDYK